MELKRIIISEVHEQQIIVLREVDGERSFPIVIGIFEATSIDRRVKNIVPPRPLTHDLIVSVVEQLGGDVQDIVISDLQDHTYFAKLRVRKDGELIEIDCRPSDAIAVAVTAKVRIWVAEDVLAETFTRAFAARGRAYTVDGSLRAWLYKIATNLIADELRRRERASVAPRAAAGAGQRGLRAVRGRRRRGRHRPRVGGGARGAARRGARGAAAARVW
jgi:bifunctional DNase/RNase